MGNNESVEENNEKQTQDTPVDDNNEKNEGEQTDATNQEQAETQEENPYKAQLKAMEDKHVAELAEKDARIQQKDGALKQERQKRKDAEAVTEDPESETETKTDEPNAYDSKMKEMEDKMAELQTQVSNKAVTDEIAAVTNDESEAQLISKIVEEKNCSVADAKLFANAHKIEAYDKLEQEQFSSESRMASYQSSTPSGHTTKSDYESDPVLKEAANNLDPETRKYLSR